MTALFLVPILLIFEFICSSFSLDLSILKLRLQNYSMQLFGHMIDNHLLGVQIVVNIDNIRSHENTNLFPTFLQSLGN